ncbi:hypothetical protein HBP45_09020 [Listeria welshimeri]|nr:hypothetical protein [Listeria welshimeri]MBC2349021.1 hypothetical protein [Listeria welshimeri]
MTKSLEEIGTEIGAKTEKVVRKSGEVAGTVAKISVYSSVWAVKMSINKSRSFIEGFKQGWSSK